MKLAKFAFACAALASVALAQAETRVIEGRGVAKNAAGIPARFGVNVRQVDNTTPTGQLEFGWTAGDRTILITCLHPRFVGVREHEGRMHGPAKVTVKRGTETRTWEGTVYFTALDLRRPDGGTGHDKVRIRFIRDVWGNPEGDFFFEGVVTEGGVSVLKR